MRKQFFTHDNVTFSSKDCPPFDKGAFRIEINFPAEYPFKPPKITFKTKIYHPNIDEKGQICLPILSVENWKPATRTSQGEVLLQVMYLTLSELRESMSRNETF